MTTPPSDPEHCGLSPLSPYGEGYCRVCQFIVGLDPHGLLVAHTRHISIYHDERNRCDGSDTRPPKKTPYASRRAAFRTSAKKADCRICGQEVSVLADGRMRRHSVTPYRLSAACDGSYQLPGPPERDHGRERG